MQQARREGRVTYGKEHRAGIAAASRLWRAVQVVYAPAALHLCWQEALVCRCSRTACQLLPEAAFYVAVRYHLLLRLRSLHPEEGTAAVVALLI
jgi:hypothetical protein